MGKFASGKYAYGISDRSGMRYRLRDMKVEWNGSLVGPDEFERKHPQLGPFRVPVDGQALKNARTDRSEPAVAVLLGLNPFVHSGSGLITVTEKNHGRSTGNTVRFRTATGIGTEITKALIESASGYAITVTTTDQYTFTIPGISAATESVNYTVTVVGGNPSNHPSYNVGSSNKYAINGSTATADVQLTFKVGSTYRFTLSSSDMSSHPLRLYLDADKTTQYTTGVTSTSTYTEITVASGAPSTLFYQCSIHGNMGAQITVTDIDLGLNTQFGGEIATAGPVTLES
tara:strand:+ start:693 stop:1553 length:861 start_codon:yes stop_codon:yes gene_type:complete